mmetsp:Transcript_53621/g.173127  ORF Transcript_53621/g.173127 Transcript_53621/m.173127 type:complete len:85 (+) Transcript_53621:956-1210(+)
MRASASASAPPPTSPAAALRAATEALGRRRRCGQASQLALRVLGCPDSRRMLPSELPVLAYSNLAAAAELDSDLGLHLVEPADV